MFCGSYLKRVCLSFLVLVALLLMLSACSSGVQPGDTPGVPVEPPPSTETDATLEEPGDTPGSPVEPTESSDPDDPSDQPTSVPEATVAPPESLAVGPSLERPALPLSRARGDLFSASGACTSCHTRMVDAAGVDVSTDAMWGSTMMANSSRDPYWLASIRAEVNDHPLAQQAIEEKCATCHMPMAWFSAVHQEEPIAILGDGFYPEEHELYPFAMDGVSCTLCHQIEDQNLGSPESFSGGFVIDTAAPTGERVAYGPYMIPPGQAVVMTSASGYKPLYAEHTQRSELCATCHTLITDTLDADAAVISQFPEQMVFFEWQHSSYLQSHACQDCHMPVASGSVSLSITGSPPRQPFYQHEFVGGNIYMSKIFDQFAGDLGVSASSDQFMDTQMRTLDQLQNRTVTVQFDSLQIQNSELVADLVINSQVGHKLPTGFPSRRVWVHFTVQDASGALLFESGRPNSDGSIQGNANDVDPARYEPHYQVIDSPDQVQIYEGIFVDVNGEITTGLLKGYEYIKDNRILPAGFDKLSANPEFAVFGNALEDEDFVGGIDRLRYQVELGGAQGPFTVTANVFYQTIGYRWMENLRAFQLPETDQMATYYDAISNVPVMLVKVSQQVGE
jgi:hypothetical protein